MNSEQIAKRDAEFFAAFSKDKKLNRRAFNAAWAKQNRTKVDYKCGFETLSASTPEHKKIYTALADYCTKFPNVKTPNIVLSGATGTGKTVAARVIYENLRSRGVDVQFVTAFSMVNSFQRYVQSFGRDDQTIDTFCTCKLLIIDDLGAEPIIKNVTQEHIYNIINERLANGLPFIITTNLSPAGIMERYDQRIASRILAKKIAAIIEFKGSDLRIKN